jgi:hypothetical protein
MKTLVPILLTTVVVSATPLFNPWQVYKDIRRNSAPQCFYGEAKDPHPTVEDCKKAITALTTERKVTLTAQGSRREETSGSCLIYAENIDMKERDVKLRDKKLRKMAEDVLAECIQHEKGIGGRIITNKYKVEIWRPK